MATVARIALALLVATTPLRVGAQSLPLVVFLDSAHEARVYDNVTLAAGKTNADVLSNLVADLPIRRHAETISPDWKRDEEIKRLNPALVVVHYSGFNLADATGPRERLKLLISNLATSRTRILVYSRAHEADLVANLSALLIDVYAANPDLRERVRVFGLLDYGPPQWVNSATALEFKRFVRIVLGLP